MGAKNNVKFIFDKGNTLPFLLIKVVASKKEIIFSASEQKFIEKLGYNQSDVTFDDCCCPNFMDYDEFMSLKEEIFTFNKTELHREIRLIHKNGHMLFFEADIKTASVDKTTNVDIYLHDISAYREQTERLKSLSDSSDIAMIEISEQTEEIVFANRNIIFSTINKNIGEKVSSIAIDEIRESVQDSIHKFITNKERDVFASEWIVKDRNDRTFPAEIILVKRNGKIVAYVRDISRDKAREGVLLEREKHLQSVAAAIPGMLFRLLQMQNGDIKVTYMSDGVKEFMGISPYEMMANPYLLREKMYRPDRDRYETFLKECLLGHRELEEYKGEINYYDKNGDLRCSFVRSSPEKMEDGCIRWSGIAIDITDKKRVEEELEFLAFNDVLTKLGNKRWLLKELPLKLAKIKNKGSQVAIISIKPDRLNQINATSGYKAGDKMLVELASRLKENVGEPHIISRTGGHKFGVVLYGVKNKDALREKIDRLRASLERTINIDKYEYDMTVSMGISLYPEDGVNSAVLIANSESALENGAEKGLGQISYYNKAHSDKIQQNVSMRSRLKRAIENREIVSFFQPQIDTISGKIVGTEALARWITNTGEIIPPSMFIPVAEEYGLTSVIAEAILDDACMWNRRWDEKGIASVPVAVNISAKQFDDEEKLFKTVMLRLEETGLPPKLLELEITETAAMSNQDGTRRMINRFKQAGVATAIDDFGTGYSSLGALKDFPVSKLKIDRAFIMNLQKNANDIAIVEATIAMAQALNIKTLAEGVEEIEQFNILKKLGCNTIQGYLFSEPLSAVEMENMFVYWDAKKAAGGLKGILPEIDMGQADDLFI